MSCLARSSRGLAGILFALFVAGVAIAQQPRQPFWTQGATTRGAEPARVRLSSDGYVLTAGAAPGTSFSSGLTRGATPDAVALSFLTSQARWFSDATLGSGYSVARVKAGAGRNYVKLVQVFTDVPVFGSGVIVQVRGNAVEYVSADVMRDFAAVASGYVSTTPTITADEAVRFSSQWSLSEFGVEATAATEPSLAIYDPGIVGNEGDVRLVWRFELINDAELFREVVLVDAHEGKVATHYSLIHDALNREIRDANNTDSLGAVVRAEGQGPSGNSEVDEVYDLIGDVYQFYAAEHGRDGLDDAGDIVRATVRFCLDGFECPFPNASWDGTRLWFGEGFQVDDVVAHEATHGVTTHESNLIYMNESGAINESFSDMWGEWIDLTNGAGDDSAAVRWIIGEDLPPTGPRRNMADPTAFGDPDRMGSQHFYTGPIDDGGVHTNSGVGNKLAYLLTDGGTFNGFTIDGLGISLAADLMYECQTNLLSPSANYFDLYDAIVQASVNLGFTAGQRLDVDNAGRAVEIRFVEGVHSFGAMGQTGVPEIGLSWENPNAGTFTVVRVRRSATGFPSDPDASGTLVYEGADESFTDSSVVLGTVYYYSIWAYHGWSERSPVSVASTEAGVSASSPTERFGSPGDEFDLQFKRIAFWPNGPTAYDVRRVVMTDFPTNPADGERIWLNDDDFERIDLTEGKEVILFGVPYSSLYVASNGRITFGGSDGAYEESLSEHFSLPGISAFFDDLNPAEGGKVSYREESDRVAVTYQNVPEYGTSNLNNFQIELFYDGRIRVTYLGMAATDAIVGVSAGSGTPLGFVETDLSGAPVPAAPFRPWAWALCGLSLVLCARWQFGRIASSASLSTPPRHL